VKLAATEEEGYLKLEKKHNTHVRKNKTLTPGKKIQDYTREYTTSSQLELHKVLVKKSFTK